MSILDYHYETMGRILAYLINRGFARVDFSASDAMDIMTERRGDEEEVLVAFADVLHWMLAEGLIRVSSVHEYEGGYDFIGVQLTARGVAVIKTEPDDEERGVSIEKRVTEAKATDLDAAAYTKIGSFVGGLLGGFTKAVGT